MTKSILSILLLALCTTHLHGGAYFRGKIHMQKNYKVSLNQITWGTSPDNEEEDRIQCQVFLDEESKQKVRKITLVFEVSDIKKEVSRIIALSYTYDPYVPPSRKSPLWLYIDFPRVENATHIRLFNVFFDEDEEIPYFLRTNISNIITRSHFKQIAIRGACAATFTDKTPGAQAPEPENLPENISPPPQPAPKPGTITLPPITLDPWADAIRSLKP